MVSGTINCRRQYYIVREDAVAVISVSSEDTFRDLAWF